MCVCLCMCVLECVSAHVSRSCAVRQPLANPLGEIEALSEEKNQREQKKCFGLTDENKIMALSFPYMIKIALFYLTI